MADAWGSQPTDREPVTASDVTLPFHVVVDAATLRAVAREFLADVTRNHPGIAGWASAKRLQEALDRTYG